MRKVRRVPLLAAPLLLLLFVSPFSPAAAAETSRYQALFLPGPPSAIVPADVDGDGRLDLAVAVAVTRWDQISVEESMKMDDVDGLVEVLTVIPALLEKRELRVFLGRSGGYAPEPLTLELDASVLSIEAGPPGASVIALTDSGLSALRLQAGVLSWEPLFEERSLLSGTGTFVPNLGMVQDLDGDGRADVLFPTREGASVYLSSAPSGPDGLRRASKVKFPLDDLQPEGAGRLSRLYPLPEVREVTGDKLPDLVLQDPRGSWQGVRVLRNLGGGRFAEAVRPLPPLPMVRRKPGQPPPPPRPVVVWFGDLDGDGRAEYVTQEARALPQNAGIRQEMKNAKLPHFQIRLHHARPDLTMEPSPYRQFEVEGYSFDSDDGSGGGDGEGGGGGDSVEAGFTFPGGLQDLNGDRRPDLVAITLDFSLFQALKAVTMQRITVALDFHVWCQKADGSFQSVRGLDLSGNLNLNFRDLRAGQLSQFAGDFDGDGRPDFLQLGRGKAATIHRGRADCSFPARPDLTIPLKEPPLDLGLVQVRDLDGDKKSDLLVIQPQAQQKSGDQKEGGITPPVRLDLYLSNPGGGAR